MDATNLVEIAEQLSGGKSRKGYFSKEDAEKFIPRLPSDQVNSLAKALVDELNAVLARIE